MLTAISIVHVLVAVALVFIVLLQTGRGSEIGAAFGSGASQTLFGSSGTSGFMTRLTTIIVVVFMVTSLVLAIMYSKGRVNSPVRPRSAPVERSAPVVPPPGPAAPSAPAAPAK
jgi:preprotein translocase subunit SecG